MCDICQSGLLDELNKKRNWRPDRVIKWAGRRGLKIDQKQLEKHFNIHLNSVSKNKNIKVKKTVKVKEESGKAARTVISGKEQPSIIEHDTSITPVHPADDQFLNEVIGRVFQNLTGGKFELKLEHGFKAIEIKQKISDTTNVENLLLELLNEIRTQELAAPNPNESSQSVK
ncbi:MAG: hypothetical protein GY839_11610 [candidate division Zixibacteria bacterium]|nr:hypothetical protein [candidate division Zixibacteria bacterium]